MVALWRALADSGHTRVPGFADPYAAAFLRGRWAVLHRSGLEGMRRADALSRTRAARRYEFVVFRVVALDRKLLDAVAGGAGQVVILGAGFDTRVWRHPELASARVFEVDHPDTQAVKRTRSAGLPAPHAPPVYVPVDFTRDRLVDRLAEAGHDPTRPTVWLWEGVVMYLDDAAVAATLADIAGRSAPGSTLLLHYHTPDPPGLLPRLRSLGVRLLGEPLTGARSPDAVAALVHAAGLTLEEDLDLAAQGRLAGAEPPDDPYGEISRIVVARR